LWYNRIEVIGPELLNHLPKLTSLDLVNNYCVSMWKNGTSTEVAIEFQNTTNYCKEEYRMETMLKAYGEKERRIIAIYNEFLQEKNQRRAVNCGPIGTYCASHDLLNHEAAAMSATGTVKRTQTEEFNYSIEAEEYVRYLRGNLSDCYNRGDNLTNQIRDLNMTLLNVNFAAKECNMNIKNLNSIISNKIAEIGDLNQKLNVTINREKELEGQIKNLNTQIVNIEEAKNKLNLNISISTNNIQNYERRISACNKDYDILVGEKNNLTNEMWNLHKINVDLDSKVQLCQKMLDLKQSMSSSSNVGGGNITIGGTNVSIPGQTGSAPININIQNIVDENIRLKAELSICKTSGGDIQKLQNKTNVTIVEMNKIVNLMMKSEKGGCCNSGCCQTTRCGRKKPNFATIKQILDLQRKIDELKASYESTSVSECESGSDCTTNTGGLEGMIDWGKLLE
jgi:DNA repair exonuclease SbcCD ATPase subunit